MTTDHLAPLRSVIHDRKITAPPHPWIQIARYCVAGLFDIGLPFGEIRRQNEDEIRCCFVLDVAEAKSEAEGQQLRECLKVFDNRFGKRQGTSLRKVALTKEISFNDLVRKLEEHASRLKTVCS